MPPSTQAEIGRSAQHAQLLQEQSAYRQTLQTYSLTYRYAVAVRATTTHVGGYPVALLTTNPPIGLPDRSPPSACLFTRRTSNWLSNDRISSSSVSSDATKQPLTSHSATRRPPAIRLVQLR